MTFGVMMIISSYSLPGENYVVSSNEIDILCMLLVLFLLKFITKCKCVSFHLVRYIEELYFFSFRVS